MGIIGRTRDWSFRARFVGEFRQQTRQKFMPCEAWQYNTRLIPARIYYMRIDFAGVLPMFGVDLYQAGPGRMRGKLLGMITVADGSGPECLAVQQGRAEVHDCGVVPSTEEALEDLVHQKRGPDKRLEDGQQVLAERVGLLPEEDQRTNQAQRIDGVASTCTGLIHAALTIRAWCGIGHSHSPTVCELTVRRPARAARQPSREHGRWYAVNDLVVNGESEIARGAGSKSPSTEDGMNEERGERQVLARRLALP